MKKNYKLQRLQTTKAMNPFKPFEHGLISSGVLKKKIRKNLKFFFENIVLFEQSNGWADYKLQTINYKDYKDYKLQKLQTIMFQNTSINPLLIVIQDFKNYRLQRLQRL